MTGRSEDRREELRQVARDFTSTDIYSDELLDLLDMADERDRYRSLLEEAKPYLKAHGWELHHAADRGLDRAGHRKGDQAWSVMSDIDAALEDTGGHMSNQNTSDGSQYHAPEPAHAPDGPTDSWQPSEQYGDALATSGVPDAVRQLPEQMRAFAADTQSRADQLSPQDAEHSIREAEVGAWSDAAQWVERALAAAPASEAVPKIEPINMLTKDNHALKEAGSALAAAAARVTQEYDGVHRLSLAAAAWHKAVADEGGRASAPASEAVSEYRPIETAPEGVRVLLKGGIENPPVVGEVTHYEEEGSLCSVLHYNGDVLVGTFHATHWRPLDSRAVLDESTVDEYLSEYGWRGELSDDERAMLRDFAMCLLSEQRIRQHEQGE